MPAMPQLETPNIAGMYAGLGQTVQGGFDKLAQNLQAYGKFQHEGEIRDAAAKELDARLSPGSGAEWRKVTADMDLKDATRVAHGAILYADKAKEVIANYPDAKPIDVKNAISLIAQDPDRIDKYLEGMEKNAGKQQGEAETSNTQQQLSSLSQGLNTPTQKVEPIAMQAPESTKGISGEQDKSPYFIGQTIRSQVEKENRPVFTQDLAKGVEQTAIPLSGKTGPQMAQTEKQYINEKDYIEQQRKAKETELHEEATAKKGTDDKLKAEGLVRGYLKDAADADKEIARLNAKKDELKKSAQAAVEKKAAAIKSNKPEAKAEKQKIRDSWYETIKEQDEAINKEIAKHKANVETTNNRAAELSKEHGINLKQFGTASGKGKAGISDADYAAFYEKTKGPNDPSYNQLTPAQKQHVQAKYQK